MPRAYLVAGTLEPFFRDNAARWAAALHNAKTDVVMRDVASRVSADGCVGVWRHAISRDVQ
jgi:hypothetical protein